MAETLYWQVKRQRLFAETALFANGVAIRAEKADYVHYPSQDPRLEAWVFALHGLNCEAAFTLTSSVAAGITNSLAPGTLEVCLTGEDRIQVVETVHGLARARKAQGACFVRTQGCLIVWADNVKDLIDAGMNLKEKMVNYIWSHTKQINAAGSMPSFPTSNKTSSANSNASSASSVAEKAKDAGDKGATPRQSRFPRIFSTTLLASARENKEKEEDAQNEKEVSGEDLVDQLESGEPKLEEGRSVNMFAPLYTGLSLGLNLFLSGLLIRRLLIESLLDGRWLRMTIALALPFIMCIIQFFCESVISVIVQIFFPVSQLNRNSLYFSGKRSVRLPTGKALPHFTVAIPGAMGDKYAFGCSELVFNPLRYWPTRGPFSPLFRTFLWSKCSTAYKFNACSYNFSYWAIASATPLTMVYFFVHGFFSPTLDGAFLPSFQSWLSVLFVFCVGGLFGHVIFKVRAGKATLYRAVLDHIKWIPAFSAFFAELSYHVLLALMAHITGYDMTWSATVKDVTESNFWKEIPAMLRRFWHCYLVMLSFMAAVIIFSSPLVPLKWRIEGFTVFWPPVVLISSHVLYPLVLNPWLVRFEF
ncbi:uncharacterized protein SPSC_04991 [Sporisorium scitamineum]|uniref:DUF7928 domain-containing protein n=1 Tax=Sporisorium scitamineum TaxID=49012 RepID=A0A127ZHN5_9BASI|nr:uncharacterized protein SPSC_04991 [Sporisorium scitamineum]